MDGRVERRWRGAWPLLYVNRATPRRGRLRARLAPVFARRDDDGRGAGGPAPSKAPRGARRGGVLFPVVGQWGGAGTDRASRLASVFSR